MAGIYLIRLVWWQEENRSRTPVDTRKSTAPSSREGLRLSYAMRRSICSHPLSRPIVASEARRFELAHCLSVPSERAVVDGTTQRTHLSMNLPSSQNDRSRQAATDTSFFTCPRCIGTVRRTERRGWRDFFDISAVDFRRCCPATIGFTSPSGDSLKNRGGTGLPPTGSGPPEPPQAPLRQGCCFHPTPYTATHANACIAATKATQPFHRISHHSSLSAVPRPPRGVSHPAMFAGAPLPGEA